MPNRREFDHLFNGRFKIEIEGVTQGAFTECGGIEAHIDVVHFNHGSDLRTHKRPGRPGVANIVLKRGVTAGTELWDWFKSALDGQVSRKNGSIIVCDDAGDEIYRHNFFEAWPCRWKSLELRADQPGSLVEEIEIVVEAVERG
jgi:phage tail-like protein